MKEIELYFKDPKETIELRHLVCFEHSLKYNIIDFQKLKQHEYGRLRLDNVIIRIIHEPNYSDKCPWCGCEEVDIKVIKPEMNIDIRCMIIMFVECKKCLSRGPRLNVNLSAFDNDPDNFKNIILEKWKWRSKYNVDS